VANTLAFSAIVSPPLYHENTVNLFKYGLITQSRHNPKRITFEMGGVMPKIATSAVNKGVFIKSEKYMGKQNKTLLDIIWGFVSPLW